MILVEDQYGYYIHGESIHSHADCNMKEFNLNLEREKENIVVNRGLITGNGKQGQKQAVPSQSFQMYLTSQFRDELKQRYLLPTMLKNQKELQKQQNKSTAEQKQKQEPKNTKQNDVSSSNREYPRFYDVVNGRLPFLMRYDVPSETMIETYSAVNAYLKQFITGVCNLFENFLQHIFQFCFKRSK